MNNGETTSIQIDVSEEVDEPLEEWESEGEEEKKESFEETKVDTQTHVHHHHDKGCNHKYCNMPRRRRHGQNIGRNRAVAQRRNQ